MQKSQLTRTASANTNVAPVEAGDMASIIGATSHRVKQSTTTAPVEPGAVGSP